MVSLPKKGAIRGEEGEAGKWRSKWAKQSSESRRLLRIADSKRSIEKKYGRKKGRKERRNTVAMAVPVQRFPLVPLVLLLNLMLV